MTSEPSSSIISTASTTTPSSTLAKNHPSTRVETIISIGSVVIGVFFILILAYVIALCRRHQKYQRPENRSEVVDVESAPGDSVSKLSKDDFHSISNVLLITKPNENLNSGEWQYSKDAYGLATQEPDSVSLGNAQSLRDDVGSETITLHSVRPISSKPMRHLSPLIIPEKPLNRSNRRSSIQRRGSKPSPDLPHSGLEVDDTASVYSEESAYSSITPPPMPPIPPRYAKPLQLTLPECSDSDVIVIARRLNEDGTITKSFPSPFISTPIPSSKFSEDEDQDETEIYYNVAKLLHSRQNRLRKTPNPPSRNTSAVSHIEREGSIRPPLSHIDHDTNV